MQPIQILLVDDDPSFMELATYCIARTQKAVVVGNAVSRAEGISKIKLLRPQLVLMDFSMPGMEGIRVAREIKLLADPPKVVVMSFHDPDALRTQAADVLVDGYISKMDFIADLESLLDQFFFRAAHVQ